MSRVYSRGDIEDRLSVNRIEKADKRLINWGKAWPYLSVWEPSKTKEVPKEKKGNLFTQSLLYTRYFHINDFT